MQNKRTNASNMAQGGILAALAVVIMNLGTLIPVATYTCPMLCALLLQRVLKACGKRVAWAWYGAVTILSLLMAPDKEAAVVFLFFGYYPIVKPWMDRRRGKWLWKALLFNLSGFAMCRMLMYITGLPFVGAEFQGYETLMTLVFLLLGNVTFFLLDKLLGMYWNRKK